MVNVIVPDPPGDKVPAFVPEIVQLLAALGPFRVFVVLPIVPPSIVTV